MQINHYHMFGLDRNIYKFSIWSPPQKHTVRFCFTEPWIWVPVLSTVCCKMYSFKVIALSVTYTIYLRNILTLTFWLFSFF